MKLLTTFCSRCLNDDEIQVIVTSFCTKCNKYFCEFHTNRHNTLIKDHFNDITPIIIVNNNNNNNHSEIKSLTKAVCPIHQLELEEFCRDCDEIICAKCFAKSHKAHNVVTIDNVANEEKKKTILLIDTLTKQLKDLEVNGSNEELEKEIVMIKEKGEKCQLEIDDYFNKLNLQLQKRKEVLTNELKTIVDEKLKLINDFKTLQKEMNEISVNKVEKMSNYEMIEYQLNVLKKLQKETKELLQNQQSIQTLHQFEIINLKEKEMNEMINEIGKINQKVICSKYCQLIEMNFKENDTIHYKNILKFKIQLKDYKNDIIQLDNNKQLTSYSLQCYLKEIDSDKKLIELQKEITENNYHIEMTIPEIVNDKKVELFIFINNYQITKLHLNITSTEWDNHYLTDAQLLNKNKTINKINGSSFYSYKLTPIIKLTNNFQIFKFKIDKESNCTWFGICNVVRTTITTTTNTTSTNYYQSLFNHHCVIGHYINNNNNKNGNNILEYSFGSHSSLSYISNCNEGKEIRIFKKINFKTGDVIIIQLKRGQFILINETRFKNQPCVCNIPLEMEFIYLVVSLRQQNSQITLLN